MTKVIICSAAEIDFTESLKWYAEKSIDAANEFDLEFNRAISQIVADPERFPKCDTRHRYFLLRRFPFRVIYRIVSSIASLHRALLSLLWLTVRGLLTFGRVGDAGSAGLNCRMSSVPNRRFSFSFVTRN